MIGILSDSHGDLAAFDAAYELLRGKGARRFIFAGGSYADLDEWIALRKKRGRGGAAELDKLRDRFLRVPEKESREYRDASISAKAMDMMADALCCVVHDKDDLTRDDLENATVFIHGRQPAPNVVQIGPRFFITPGRLSGAAEQTCGLVEIVEKNLKFSAFRLDGKTVLDGQMLVLDRRTKLSVK